MPLRSEAWLDRHVGMLYYITDTEGIGGRVKERLEDFIVEEVLINGEVVPTTVTGKPLPKIQERPGPWLWLIIEKRGVDAMTMMLMLGKRLRIRLSDISFGGLKDAIAITSQIVSIRGASQSEIPGEIGRGIRVLAVYTMDKPFTTADIWGNEFTIRVRGVETSKGDLIGKTLRQIDERGLPCYYGYQRFGIKRPNTHIVGKYIILGDYERAVEELLIRVYPMEDERIKRVKEFLAKTGDYTKALEMLPKSFRYYPERVIMRHLASNPRDYVNALRKLPKELISIFVEAYQSYLFNLALSLRIERGLPINQAVVGDMVVLLDEHGLPTRHMIHVTESLVDRVNEMIKKGRAVPVAHLMGYKVKPLPGPQGDIEREVLKMEGIDPSMFRLRAFPRASLKGGFRPLSVKPIVKHIVFENSNLNIVFRLPRGNYATVFLRELIKPRNPELTFT